jgi:hypothetical protein
MTRWQTGRAAAGLVAAVTLTGCAGFEGAHLPDFHARAIARAYRDGVRDGAARLATERDVDLGTGSEAPTVQEIWMPARLVDGLVIPAHREWVVIHPAGWRRSPASTVDSMPARPAAGERRRP